VWEALTPTQQNRMLSPVTRKGVAADEYHEEWLRRIELRSRRRPGIGQHPADPSLAWRGLFGALLSDGRRPLTPLGVEVYLHGRRAGQRP
jgi:hypothetical protein